MITKLEISKNCFDYKNVEYDEFDIITEVPDDMSVYPSYWETETEENPKETLILRFSVNGVKRHIIISSKIDDRPRDSDIPLKMLYNILYNFYEEKGRICEIRIWVDSVLENGNPKLFMNIDTRTIEEGKNADYMNMFLAFTSITNIGYVNITNV